HTLTGHSREATAVAFSPNGQLLASACWDQKVRLWDPATGKEVRSFTWVSEPGRVDPLSSLAFHSDGRHLAVASDPYGGGGSIKVYNLALGAEVHSIPGHIYGILGVCFSPDGSRLASVSCDGGAIVWDPVTGQELFSFHNRNTRGREEEVALDSRLDAMH